MMEFTTGKDGSFTPLFSLMGLSKSYGRTQALRELNLHVHNGETVGLLGYSGAGKTTLLRILAGLEFASAGELLYRGQMVNPKTSVELRKKVTMLFQNPIHLRGDVYTNISYGLKIRGVPENQVREIVCSVLARVRLEGFQSRTARKLSGGEQQRVALARALVLEPDVLLLDEPTSNLDPANSSVITEVIRAESRSRTIILATHNFNQVRRLTQRSIYMEDGQIVEDGPTEELFKHPRDERTARFINGEF